VTGVQTCALPISSLHRRVLNRPKPRKRASFSFNLL
jgi:hypothetical protein